MKIALTGHRPQKIGQPPEWLGQGPASDYIRREILKFLVEQNKKGNKLTLISGMALGCDLIFADIAVRANLPLIAAIPFEGQSRVWSKENQIIYNKILEYPKCTKHVVCDGGYSAKAMQVRNEWMVDNCDMLIAVYDGTSGGTGNCVKYAEQIGKEYFRIDPRKYKD